MTATIDASAGWSALCAAVLVLGVRHGLDADHLAAIDGLTRVSARQRLPHARWCGALFSLGHGVVVLAIALLTGAMGARWVPPESLETAGALVSIALLTTLGLANLLAVLRAPPDAVVGLVGVRGRFTRRLLGRAERASGAPAVLGVGALFALSFDTLSQAALFAVLALHFGGVAHAAVLGLLFALGMLAADGVNGWWMARLIDRTDRMAVVASRTMTMAVACVSLLVAALGALRLASGGVGAWLHGQELALGLLVIAVIALAYAAARRRAAKPPAATP